MSVQEIIAASVANGRDVVVRKKDVLQLAIDGGLISSKISCPPCAKRVTAKPMKFS